ncbi:hypothetical protein C1H46_039638 [Malus baccata]|uniref:CRC domain-containing protein n=1 Tax=Malus baccata TaxID=106549 RepID=A0A540KKT8_MALBA|nr:hypothetical protein C1H46_039638 [Malus baccata]
MLVEQEADPCDAGVSPSQDTDSINELNQLSHKRKRQSTIVYSSSSSQRVLIIGSYCECFSAGVYCLDSYACQNCYNKPEFEHTVFEIRHHIESRNPLAFTSKVVDNAIDSSANSTEDQNLTTTSSARHKRGSNCKKSKCLEKYCERLKLAVLEDVDARIAKIPLALWQRFLQLHQVEETLGKFHKRNCHQVSIHQILDACTGAVHPSLPPTHQTRNVSHFHNPRSRLRSSSPTGLRSGRKFILHAVPFFPPLTPYHTSKEGTSEIGNDDGATNKNNWYEAQFGCFSELIMDNLLTAYSIVQNNWTKLLIGFQLPQIHPKTTSVLPEVR